MTVLHTTKKGTMPRDFKPVSLEYKDAKGNRRMKGNFKNLGKGEKDKEREIKFEDGAWRVTA